MEKTEERLNFLLENLYIGTGAATIGIIDKKGGIAAECGRLDVSLVKKMIPAILSANSDILRTYWGKEEKNLINIVMGESGSFFFAPINESLLILCLYPKGVDLILIYKELSRYISDLRELVRELHEAENRRVL